MKRHHLFAFRGALAGTLLATFCTAAMAAPIIIDTEAKAAAAVIAAHHLGLDSQPEPARHIERIVGQPRIITTIGLETLAASTTPWAVYAPGGVTVPCALGGTLNGRMHFLLPNLLQLEWHDCVTHDLDIGIGINTFKGPSSVTLPFATFTPAIAADIRLGSLTRDFQQTRLIDMGDNGARDIRRFNLRIAGLIRMQGADTGEIPGAFRYVVLGFFDNLAQALGPDFSAPPLAQSRSILSAEALLVSGALTVSGGGTVHDESLLLHAGKLSQRIISHLSGDTTSVLRPIGLHIRSVSDETASTRTARVDGIADYTWRSGLGAGCLNGMYVFQTVAPLVSQGWSNLYASGELRVNGVSTARYYSAATVPPWLPAPSENMLINVTTAAVGSFNYESSFNAADALGPVGQCIDLFD